METEVGLFVISATDGCNDRSGADSRADLKSLSPSTDVRDNVRQENVANSKLFITMNSATTAEGITKLFMNVYDAVDHTAIFHGVS